ncbi:unnamed protein product [Adineta steineri]|uniref:Protein kinase domain-containing protein n=1 Tax=Adineta steineri TaxID=433720 RepID=A0A815CWH3_9BILA|nr:unnamed protein product [Adineta steineri]CAF3718816.1 unnamed protein product [Adineta steineri]
MFALAQQKSTLELDTWRYTIVTMPLERKTLLINGYEYHFDKKLGRGSFGAVYAAHRYPDNKPVAIKVVSLATRNSAVSMQNSEAVLNEIEMARRLAQTSDHIIHMYDFDFHRHTGLSFIVMELGQQDLERFLSHRRFLTPDERKNIWRQLVDIANTLHNYQIVHFDIKPQNLVVFPGGIVKLVDLGIAQKAFQRRIGPNGSQPYSAPEVTLISLRHITINTTKADVWSWGAVLFRMTYMTAPDYFEPCYHPPRHQRQTRDPHLRDILRNTLVIDPRARPDPSWFLDHPYTLSF